MNDQYLAGYILGIFVFLLHLALPEIPCFTGVISFFTKRCIIYQIRGCGHLRLTLEPPLPETQTSRHGATDGLKRRRWGLKLDRNSEF